MKMSVAVRMYKGKQQTYAGTRCIDADNQTEVQNWFFDLCETTLGADADDVVRVRHSDVITMDMEKDTYNMQMIATFTLENGVRYVMLGYVKFYDVDEES